MSRNDNGTLRRSIEVEYWVIDDEGRLVEPGALVDASPGAEREFVEPLLEIKTTPCETARELREELLDRVGAVLRRAEELGMGLVPLSTPIHAGELPDHPNERTRIQDRIVGDRFEYVRHCAGTHVHFEQHPGRVVDQLNALTAMDPALALVNSSSHFRGAPLAAGARSRLYRRMAYQELPYQGRLWSYVDSTEEWHQRTERRYEELLEKAATAGIAAETVEAHFDPESAVWIPVKLRERFSTVEWRTPDTALPSEVLRLADELADVLEGLESLDVEIGGEGRRTDDRLLLPEFDALRRYVDDAIDDGVTAPVDSYLRRMGFDVDAYDPTTEELPSGRITEREARRLRLSHSERLESDVRTVKKVHGD
ncbi:MAG: glutamate-cysteine ligase family protein [Natronomonas sp.]